MLKDVLLALFLLKNWGDLSFKLWFAIIIVDVIIKF